MVIDYCYLKKYNIHEIGKDMIYVLSNLGYQGFIFGTCFSSYGEENIDKIVDFLCKENDKSFLYHPLIFSEKNIESTKESDSFYNDKYTYSLLFLFHESVSVELMEKTFQQLEDFVDKIKEENKYYFNTIRALREESYTQRFEAYIEPEYASYISMLMNMINGTYEETRLEEYEKALKNKRNVPMYQEETKSLKRSISDFFHNKTFARYAMMQKEYGVLSEDASFTDKLILLQRYNFCHYRNHPLKFDLSVFDGKNEKEFSYEENISTLNRINHVSKMNEIVPYAGMALYETELGEKVISKIEFSFEINPDMMIPRFIAIEYAYEKNEVKFRRCLDIDSLTCMSSYDMKYIYKNYILQIIMKMALTARKYHLTMKKFKAFSYDYHLLFHVYPNAKTYLCQKPIRKQSWKKEEARIFSEMFETVSNIGNMYLERKNEVYELNKMHEKEWKRAKIRHENEMEAERRTTEYSRRQRELELEQERKPKSRNIETIWGTFFNESDYRDFLEEKRIERAYKICENYRKKHGID